jgi:hypothetical protein
VGKTIGETNGVWAIMLKVLLIAFIPWAAFLTVGQIQDNQFRGKGDRWTSADAEQQTKAIVAELMLTFQEALHEHENGGHSQADLRITFLERVVETTASVEAEETAILKRLQQDIHNYIEWLKENGE